tara:strand:- start:188684 stop:189031 length:348 start_codon:yes stop_codon:yes gene_type:complete
MKISYLLKRLSILFFTLALFFAGLSSCKSNQPEPLEKEVSILVQLYEDTAVQTLEDTFVDYTLTKEKVVSRPTKIYLFTFNSKKITDVELIKLLKESSLVKEAQQNRTVQIRNDK